MERLIRKAALLCVLAGPAAAGQVDALAALGRKLFFDPSISASGRLSCSSCHDPRAAYGPPNALPVQMGGQDMRQAGFRAAPSLRYLQAVPWFTEHYFDGESPDPSVDNGPAGGLAWDGRFDRFRDQARSPLLSPFEMANESAEAVVAKVRRAAYAAEFERLARTSPDPFVLVTEALEVFQQGDREFYPYTSKYDAFLAGKTPLTARERRGLALFNDPAKGNCARCHPADRGGNGSAPQFSDWGYAALGLPRNPEIPANRDPAWHDLGLCGPERSDLRGNPASCGQFRTPSLRNVAQRQSFFHNGVFHSLRLAVEFYAARDSRPEKWYPRGAKFDDLPPEYRGNIENGPPFGRAPGGPDALDAGEIDAIVAFLRTLTDGWTPGRTTARQLRPGGAGTRSADLRPGSRR